MNTNPDTPRPPVPAYVEGHGLLAGRRVVITAAAGSGIGSATARRFVEEGAQVLVSDIHPKRLSELSEQLGVPGVVCDVADDTSVRSLVHQATERFGALDVWINNAGLGGTRDIVDMTDDEWNRVIDISLNGTFRCLRAVLPGMYERGSGVVVNNASVMGWRAQAGQSHYAAAKAGVMALTRTAAIEAAPHGVRVNAVAPSLAMHPNLAKVTSDELLAQLRDREAFGRAAEPWEVANVMVFLASDYSSYMTGEVVSVSSQRA